MSKIIDMIGQRFGRLAVLRLDGILGKDGAAAWLCQCDCGVVKRIRGTELRSGSTVSCGCFNDDNARRLGAASATHGMSRTPVYECWVHMRARCHDPSHPNYPGYGGRGIVVCERWRDDPRVFAADMGPRPRGYSIERVDNNGPYSPENCTWIPRPKQARNKRTSRMITHDGETMCLAAWSERLGLLYGRLRAPLRRGESFAEAIKQAKALEQTEKRS